MEQIYYQKNYLDMLNERFPEISERIQKMILANAIARKIKSLVDTTTEIDKKSDEIEKKYRTQYDKDGDFSHESRKLMDENNRLIENFKENCVEISKIFEELNKLTKLNPNEILKSYEINISRCHKYSSSGFFIEEEMHKKNTETSDKLKTSASSHMFFNKKIKNEENKSGDIINKYSHERNSNSDGRECYKSRDNIPFLMQGGV